MQSTQYVSGWRPVFVDSVGYTSEEPLGWLGHYCRSFDIITPIYRMRPVRCPCSKVS